MKAAVEYRLLSIEFRNLRPRVVFNGATMHHGSRHVVIRGVKTPGKVVDGYMDKIGGREVKSIRYQVIATDPRTGKRLHGPISFCHPLPRSTYVQLLPAAGADALELRRRGGLPFFSDRFTLDGITDGAVPTTQRVYQFHE